MIDLLLEKNRRSPTPANVHPLTGLVYCECGAKCLKRHNFYYCAKISDPIPYWNSPDCDRRNGCRISTLEQFAIEAIRSKADYVSQQILRERPMQEPSELIQLRQSLDLLGDNPLFEASRQEIKQKIAALEQSQVQLSHGVSRIEEVLNACRDVRFWDFLTHDSRVSDRQAKLRFLFVQLVDRIIKSRDTPVRVIFRFEV